MHIPKNGGTFVETLLGWREDRPHWPEGVHVAADFAGCPPWHVPPRHLDPNPYAAGETFCVARDPVARLVSEFKQQHLLVPGRDHAEALAAWLFLTLDTVVDRPRALACHLVPQADFVFGRDGARTCDVILPFSNLSLALEALFAARGVDPSSLGAPARRSATLRDAAGWAQLVTRKVGHGKAPKAARDAHWREAERVGVGDVPAAVAARIRDLYADDYRRLGGLF